MRIAHPLLIGVFLVSFAIPQMALTAPEVRERSIHKTSQEPVYAEQLSEADAKFLEEVIGKECADDKKTRPPNSIRLKTQLTSINSVLLDADSLALPRGGKLCDEDKCLCWTGKATYYGPRFWGRKTSSGEVLKKGACTAAVRGFVLPTKLTVTNLGSGKTIQVRANDRIGNARATLIDIEEGCAGGLGIGSPRKAGLDGHAQVEVKYCPNSKQNP